MGVFVYEYEYPCTAGLNEGLARPLMHLALATASLILPITPGAPHYNYSNLHNLQMIDDYLRVD